MNIPNEWVEKAAQALADQGIPRGDADALDAMPVARAVLAAVLPDVADTYVPIEDVQQIVRQRDEWYRKYGKEAVRGDRLEAMLDRLSEQADAHLARAQRAEKDTADVRRAVAEAALLYLADVVTTREDPHGRVDARWIRQHAARIAREVGGRDE